MRHATVPIVLALRREGSNTARTTGLGSRGRPVADRASIGEEELTAPFPPPAPEPAPQPQPNNTLGLVSMILGIVAIPLVCCFNLGIPVGIAAAVLGFLGKQKAEKGLANNRGQALAGLICGAAAVGLGILSIIAVLVLNVSIPGLK
jgi:hypothetical protein